MIEFTIYGKPIALKRHRSTRSGRMYDPSAKDKKKIWVKIAKYNRSLPLTDEIMIQLLFVMERPKSHYRTGKFKHLLKDDIPEYHSYTPDLDNLVKMICDVIQGKDRFILDDSQIYRIQAEKIYGEKPRTEVIIEKI